MVKVKHQRRNEDEKAGLANRAADTLVQESQAQGTLRLDRTVPQAGQGPRLIARMKYAPPCSIL
jgi:hypothetical protein